MLRPTQHTYLPVSPIRRRGTRLILQNALDLHHHLRGQFWDQSQRLAVVADLLDLGRAQDDRADVLVLRRPGQRQLRRVAAQLVRDRGQLAHFVDLGFALVALQALDAVVEHLGVVRVPRAFGDPVVVFARQQPAGQRRPDRRAVLVLPEQRRVFLLEPLPVEGVVLRLLGHRRDQPVLIREQRRLRDLRRAPLRRAPVVRQVQVPDALREALDDLPHRRRGVRPMRHHHVHVRLLQPRQR